MKPWKKDYIASFPDNDYPTWPREEPIKLP